MTYKRAVTGSPLVIPAGAWNDMLAMIEKKPSRVRPRDPQRDRIRDWIQVCNTTDAELPIFSVLGLDGPLVPPRSGKGFG